ncbi:PLP-dependent aminotransferase family protein [Brucella intermedia]|uniref:aminotransferase-like domain-containing protein n=1 Tax=Brucella intermedia TaxID=94625 RepID=UPI000988E8DE|nr:PLP-dependent aminotransferase family protein [Brucella intermedia]OOC64640.1 aspartate aminotransferase [Brucella intermedia M86]
MRKRSPWQPRLADGTANAAERLMQAMSEDIFEGRLTSGDRLPAHRDLAWKLGIGVGTVTKAYAMLGRQGLTRSVKGRGTFVATRAARSGPRIDLSINTPPAMIGERLLARTLTTIAHKIDAAHLNLYAPLAGHEEHRRLLARWLETFSLAVDPRQVIPTAGAQQAISLAFDLACGPDGVILTERLTYPGAIALARHRGCRLRGIELDEEGMMPDALAAALDEEASVPYRAVYVTPTLHNPTTATMGRARRQAIVEICRRRSAVIIEDGVYAMDVDPGLLPLAALSPEHVVHVASLSKTLSPGLRIGVLTLPPGMEERAEAFLRALPIGPSPLSMSVMEDWLVNGVVASVRQAISIETRRRTALAASLLGQETCHVHPAALHAWLPMSRSKAEQFALTASALGVMVTAPDSIVVDPDDQATGIRLCLGGPSPDDLKRALVVLADLIVSSESISSLSAVRTPQR